MNQPSLRSLRSAALGVIRRGDGMVLMTPEKIGFGNMLYLWLQAAKRRAAGQHWAVQQIAGMEPWLDHFPRLHELTLPRDQVPFTAPRTLDYCQVWGKHYEREDIDTFARDFLFVEEPFEQAVRGRAGGEDHVVINVRRGDYYSVPDFRGKYSFDIVEYVESALVRALERGPIASVQVVSDDPAWCRHKLRRVLSGIPQVDIPLGDPPLENLACLVGGRRLILGNSTFSYWGAHLARVWHQEPIHVIAPSFHARHLVLPTNHLDPDWDVVDDIPCGWDG